MLTDIALKKLKPREKPYKVTDRDGMYVTVFPAGTITFRFDYRISNRRETLTLGRYGPDGLTLSTAREKCIAARNALAQGHSPARIKQREKRQLATAKTLGQFAEKWLDEGPMAESTRAMRRGIYRREVEPEYANRLLPEVSSDDVRTLCLKVKDRGSPATAIHVRDIVKGIYNFANLHGHKVENPADGVAPTSIAVFKPRERALMPEEIRVAFTLIDKVSFAHIHRLALRVILLTLVRKSELAKATWSEVDFDKGIWTIPKERMKARRPHNVYLSRQALEIFTALKLMAGSSPYVFPSRYDADVHISASTLNRVTTQIAEMAKAGANSKGSAMTPRFMGSIVESSKIAQRLFATTPRQLPGYWPRLLRTVYGRASLRLMTWMVRQGWFVMPSLSSSVRHSSKPQPRLASPWNQTFDG
jgi:integrase